MNKEERKKYVTKLVNGIRKEYGLNAGRLCKGVRQHPRANCVAMALRDTPVSTVKHKGNTVQFKEWNGKTCKIVRDEVFVQFLKDYDYGRYPELEIPMSVVTINKEPIT